jgi:hypothetical protein
MLDDVDQVIRQQRRWVKSSLEPPADGTAAISVNRGISNLPFELDERIVKLVIPRRLSVRKLVGLSRGRLIETPALGEASRQMRLRSIRNQVIEAADDGCALEPWSDDVNHMVVRKN